MSDYTPTTEEVRTDYVVAYTNAESSQLLAGMAFDRWLVKHDRETRATALEEARLAIAGEDGVEWARAAYGSSIGLPEAMVEIDTVEHGAP